ncbi:flavin reductase family protein [Nocardiopsis sp. LDBS0036]|uniref:flavin reductase family protein n=1 Tax=Nocardiopsis sp. LDBS0036 TaxID=3104276 RepID=UPI0035183138
MNMQTPHAHPPDLRSVMRLFPTGVAVLTSGSGAEAVATTVNSLISVTLDPPTVLVSLHETSRAGRVVDATGGFCLSLLSGGQETHARLFAASDKPRGEALGPYFTTTPSGCLVLRGALGGLTCETTSVRQEGDHRMYTGRVSATHLGDPADGALLFHQGRMVTA